MRGVATPSLLGTGSIYPDLVVSKPDEVIALRLEADKPGSLSFTASLSRKEHSSTATEGGFHAWRANFPSTNPRASLAKASDIGHSGRDHPGGNVTASESGLSIERADEATLIVSAGTDLFDKDLPRWRESALPARWRTV